MPIDATEIPNPKQKIDDMTWWEKIDLIRKLSIYPAITVMVFFRRRLGFRLMKPTWLIVMTIIMLTVSALFPDAAKPFRFLMVVYPLAMLGLGLFHRWQRWGELCRGERWHTYSPGISYLEALPLPMFFRSHARISRFLDPVAVLLVGVLIAILLSHALGLWIMLSAFFLHVFEQDTYERQVNRDLDTLDGMFASEVQAEVVDHFAQMQPEERRLSLEETAGIPTGLSPDIHKQIALRQARQAAKRVAVITKPLAPDNLALVES